MLCSIRQAGVLLMGLIRRFLDAVRPCVRWLLRPERIRSKIHIADLPTDRGLPERKTYQCLSGSGSYNPGLSQSRKATQGTHEHIYPDSMALLGICHIEHATVVEFWDDLKTPLQLDSKHLPIPDEWEWIFYGP